MRLQGKGSKTPPTGLEPAIFGLEVQRVIHYATGAGQKEEFRSVCFLFRHPSSTDPEIFRSCTLEARLAQSVERKALNLVVVGSSPTVGMFYVVFMESRLITS